MADVTIDGSVSTSTARGLRSVVFVTQDIGYVFYIDSDGTFGYTKTTDGGATWGAQVEIAAATTHVAFDVWFDKWTPGDNGTLIHTWYFDVTNDKIFWRTLDSNGDTLGTQRTVATLTSAVAGNNAYVTGTKAKSGYLYCCSAIDASDEEYFGRSTDGGTTWSASLSTGFQETNPDHCILFPASGTGDDNDVWAIYHDSSVPALSMKMWDSSAAAQVESSDMQTNVAVGTDLTVYQMPFSGSIRNSDGHLIVVAMSERDTATADMQVWDVSAVNAGSQTGITAKTNITTNIDDIYHPAVFVERDTGDIYVAYNGKRDGTEVLGTTTKIYYTKSTDGGTSWSAGDTAYQEGATSADLQVWCPLTGRRFYVGWRVGTTLIGNKVNSVVPPYRITIVKGQYNLSGQAVTLSKTKPIVLAQGSYALSGQSLGFGRSYSLRLKGNMKPDRISGLKIWYRLEALGLSDNASVGSCPNSASGGLGGATGGVQDPIFKTNQVNGFSAVRFRQTQGDRLYFPDLSSLSLPCTFVCVAKPENGTRFYADGNITVRIFSHHWLATLNGVGAQSSSTDDGVWAIFIGTLSGSGGTAKCWINGVVVAGPTTLGTGTVTLAGAGGADFGEGSGDPGSLGDMTDLLIYNRVISDAEIEGLTRYFANRYAISIGQNVDPGVGFYDLTGIDTAFVKGKAISITQGAYALSGQAVTLTKSGNTPTIVITRGLYALSGQTVGLLWKRLISITQGSYSLTGQSVNLLLGRKLALSQGSYALSGQALALLFAHRMVIGQGSYSLDGRAVNLSRPRIILTNQGAYVLSGQAVALLFGHRISIAQGNYSLAGQAVNLLRTRIMSIGQGAYAITGQVVLLEKGRFIALVQGQFNLNGQAVILERGRFISLLQGSFNLSGNAVSLRDDRKMVVIQGAYVLSGNVVDLTYTPIGAFTLIVDTGLFTLSGQNVGLSRTRLMGASNGAFNLNGQSVSLLWGRSIAPVQGLFVVTGFSIGLLKGWKTLASPGTFSLNGNPLVIKRGMRMPLDGGSFIESGMDVRLLRGFAIIIDPGMFNLTGFDLDMHQDVSEILRADTGLFSVTGSDVTLQKFLALRASCGIFVLTGNDAQLNTILPFDYVLDLRTGNPPSQSSLTGDDALGGLKVDVAGSNLIYIQQP